MDNQKSYETARDEMIDTIASWEKRGMKLSECIFGTLSVVLTLLKDSAPSKNAALGMLGACLQRASDMEDFKGCECPKE